MQEIYLSVRYMLVPALNLLSFRRYVLSTLFCRRAFWCFGHFFFLARSVLNLRNFVGKVGMLCLPCHLVFFCPAKSSRGWSHFLDTFFHDFRHFRFFHQRLNVLRNPYHSVPRPASLLPLYLLSFRRLALCSRSLHPTPTYLHARLLFLLFILEGLKSLIPNFSVQPISKAKSNRSVYEALTFPVLEEFPQGGVLDH